MWPYIRGSFKFIFELMDSAAQRSYTSILFLTQWELTKCKLGELSPLLIQINETKEESNEIIDSVFCRNNRKYFVSFSQI